jgi:hypothetical protein
MAAETFALLVIAAATAAAWETMPEKIFIRTLKAVKTSDGDRECAPSGKTVNLGHIKNVRH